MAEVIHYLRQVMDNSVDRGNLDSARSPHQGFAKSEYCAER